MNKAAQALARGRWARLSTDERRLALAPATAAAAERRRNYPRCERYGSHRFSPSGRCPCGYLRP